jgi:hypothetical protein
MEYSIAIEVYVFPNFVLCDNGYLIGLDVSVANLIALQIESEIIFPSVLLSIHHIEQ